MNETWIAISGTNNLYVVSNFGQVKSLPRRVASGHGWRDIETKILKPMINKSGYAYVYYTLADGQRVNHRIHRLVAKAFIPNPQNKSHINHKDGDKLNNRVSNLEWCTNQENSTHAKNNGLITHKEENHHAAKLSRGLVQEIYIMYHTEDVSQRWLANRYQVHQKQIWNIVNRKTWENITKELAIKIKESK